MQELRIHYYPQADFPLPISIAHGVLLDRALESLRRIVSLLMFPSRMEAARLLDQNNLSLDLLTEVGTQGE
jgi:hypothetical protein